MVTRRRKLLVGLGNPGSEYRNTRHNVGFMVADAFAGKHGISLSGRKFDALWGKGMVDGTEVLISMPQTYMNLSGASVSRMADFYQITREDILVVHDDMDLPFGRIRVKEKGGHAGHNGLRSIISCLGGSDFTRLRVGIGRPSHSATDHVLGGFNPDERVLIADIVRLAVEAAEAVVLAGPILAMNRFNNSDVSGKALE
ncbi:MAG: aminoacyl-tRNA hydrolase [Deltaproteobacteria bacterium]|nr:aminoacyl-tRNA hydrolase [Deltaproteobacteria bacterium]